MNKSYMKLRIALLVFSVIGLILYIAAFAIPKWSGHAEGNEGLWQMCYINGGTETCAVWSDSLKTSEHKIAQVLGCLGLAFFILFVLSGALTIFWTNHWKKARAIKYSTFFFAILAVIFVMACVFIYKNDKESTNRTLALGWFLALVGAVFAAVAAPFYLIDACRTVAPKKPDKESLFKQIGNIPPMPTAGKFSPREPDTFGGSGGRPPLLSDLRKQNTTFIHPPPKPRNKKITMKEIKSFPLPPSKTKLNLMEKSEIENHPSPVPPPTIPSENTILEDFDHVPPPPIPNENKKENCDTASIKSTSLGTPETNKEETVIEHSVFKFHKSKTVHRGGKTLLKIQNESAKLPPVMMVMPGVDENDDKIDDDIKSRTMIDNSQSQWEQEQARRKFAPYFMDMIQNPLKDDNDGDKKSKQQEKGGIKFKSLLGGKEKSTVMKGRVKEVSGIYGNKEIAEESREKPKKKSKKKKKSKRPLSGKSDVETCVNTYGNEDTSICSQGGLTIHNEIDEEV